MKWLELSTRVDREAAEAVSELFARLGRGVVVEDEGLIEGEENPNPDPLVTMRTYLALDHAADAKRQEIERGLWVLGIIRHVGPLETREIAEEDWAEAWKQHFQVHRVGRRIVIKPSWREYAPVPGEAVIELDPGMAFGTGLHPTTQLCLEEIETTLRPGATVLDVGTGSGILAIAAARLGASQVVALDNDTVAVEVATANVAASGLNEIVSVGLGSLPGPTPLPSFDLVVANIIARIIVEMAPALAEKVAQGGHLIVSGVLDERADEVAAALEAAGLRMHGQRRRADWVALVAQR